MIIADNPLTNAQMRYIEQLLIDCYLLERMKRNGFLSRFFKRDIHYIDELSKFEASRTIEKLKRVKEEIKLNSSWPSSPVYLDIIEDI